MSAFLNPILRFPSPSSRALATVCSSSMTLYRDVEIAPSVDLRPAPSLAPPRFGFFTLCNHSTLSILSSWQTKVAVIRWPASMQNWFAGESFGLLAVSRFAQSLRLFRCSFRSPDWFVMYYGLNYTHQSNKVNNYLGVRNV